MIAAAQRLATRRAALAGIVFLFAGAGVAGFRILGVASLAIPAVAFLLLLGLERPRWAVGAVVSLHVLVESAEDAGLEGARRLMYEPVLGSVQLSEGLVLFAVTASALHLAAARRPLRLGPLAVPVASVAIALAIGTVVGIAAGGGVVEQLRPALPLVLLPPAVAGVLQTPRHVRNAILLGVALAAAKVLEGLFYVATGTGPQVTGSVATYLDPAPNALFVLVLLGCLAAALKGVRLPLWMWGLVPLVLVVFTLGLRRSFYLGLAVGVVLVLVAAAGAAGRRLVLPAAVAMVLSVWAALSPGAVEGLRTPVTEPVIARVESLDITEVRRNREDRYRLAERRNVVDELRRRPLTGIGLGVPWTLRHGIPVNVAGERKYVHFAALWWWLRCGLVGALAYLSLIVAGVAMGLSVGRRHPDPVTRAAGFGAAGAVLAYAVAETTATFTGIEDRMTVLLAGVLGVLVAAHAQRDAAPTAARLAA